MPTIAIINNEKMLVELLAWNLREVGYDVRSYLRSDLGLCALLQEPADLVLIDTFNPPLGGIELLCRLRARTDMRVAFLSPMADRMREKLRGAGLEADDYIDLPMPLAELKARIARVVQ